MDCRTFLNKRLALTMIAISSFLQVFSKKDSLDVYTGKQLENKFYKALEFKSELSNIYALAYLRNAKNSGNGLHIAKGYYLILKSDPKENIQYADSLIEFSKNKDFGHFPALGYYMKAVEKYKVKKFNESFDLLVVADSVLGNVDTVETKYFVKHSIGILKSRIGRYEDALIDLKKSLEFYGQNQKWKFYASNAFAMYDAYINLKYIDSAEAIVKSAKSRLKSRNSKEFLLLKMAGGIIDFHRNEFFKAIDTLKVVRRSLDSIGNYPNVSYCDYYLGEAHREIGKLDKAIGYFESVDSTFQKYDYINPKLRLAQKELISFYRNKNISAKELYYVNSLLRLDSISNETIVELKENIVLEYEVPKLLKRKDELLQKSNSKSKTIMIVSVILGFLLTIVIILYRRKHKSSKALKSRYDAILTELEAETNNTQEKELRPRTKTTIPEKYIDLLDDTFKKYEKNNTFTKSNFNKQYICEDTGINSHYIADYLRDYKGFSITTYINNKRIEYAIGKILNDTKFGKYSMQGMADSIGYNNTSTFKRAFRGRTGMTPLEFIRQSKEKSGNS